MDSTPIAILVVKENGQELRRVPLTGNRVVIGRGAEAELRLDHGMISRKHAEFWADEQGAYRVRDLQSRNGTTLNGQPINEAALALGDEISVGPFNITFASPVATPTSTQIVIDELEARVSSLRDYVAPRVDAGHLKTLNEFGRTLLDMPAPAERAEALCRLLVAPLFQGSWAAIVRIGLDETSRPQLLHEAFGAIGGKEPYLSRSVIRRVRQRDEAVLASNVGRGHSAESDVNVSIAPNVMSLAAVGCPLTRATTSIDLLYVMLPPAMGSAEWLALVNLAAQQYQHGETAWAGRAQAATLAALEREQQRARQIQHRLVPQNPKFDRLDVAIGFRPCHSVGGDYVDAVRMKDGRVLLAIADVCGKGLAAALIASSVHTMIHASVMRQTTLQELATDLNAYLSTTLSAESFVTLIAVAIDPDSGRMEVVSGGHPPALILAPGGQVRPISFDGNGPLGPEGDPIVCHQETLGDGEMLALYTDGLTELPLGNDELLGLAGLIDGLKELYPSPRSAKEVGADLTKRLDSLLGTQAAADDRTFLLARRL